jgi:serine/threonine protein kinase
MEDLFRKESEVYQALEDLQGQFIPKCYGTFYLKFKTRELPDDRCVNTILVEKVDGERLNVFPSSSLNSNERRLLVKKIRETVVNLNRHGVFMPKIGPENFVVESPSKVMLIDFLSSQYYGEMVTQRSFQDGALHDLLTDASLLEE